MIDVDLAPQTDDELTRCLKDKRWRLNNLYYVKNKDGVRVKFKFNKAQKVFFDNMHSRNIILKARQLGFTTFIQIYILDDSLFTKNRNSGVIAHIKDDAIAFFKDKILFAYNNLPDTLKASITAKNENAGELRLNNGCVIRVGTSLRSGTNQNLHVSELGKLCAKFPEKAREVVTGALNTVHKNATVWVESTAEGRSGAFFDMCQEARNRVEEPGQLEYKFHFFGWFFDPDYTTEQQVYISPEWEEYFKTVEKFSFDNYGIKLTEGNKAWYIIKAKEQGEDMKREFPSTPDEAFEAAMAGAYYKRQMAQIRAKGQILRIPIDPTIPIHTFWDLGRDTTAIWFFQQVGFDYRFIDYFENSGEDMAYYVGILKARNDGGEKYNYGDMYLPHDGTRKGLSAKYSPADVLYQNGYNVRIVTRIPELSIGIERCRQVLPMCFFDVDRCPDGILHLDSYSKEWDDKLGTWKKLPRHDEHSHGADAFRTFAEGFHLEVERDEYEETHPVDDRQGRNEATGY